MSRSPGGKRDAADSHIILTKQGHIATLSIPNHDEVARGTLRSLISRAGLAIDEFLETLK